jgi:uncharacterized hydrophobic protein (TIGR00271 family)
MTTPPPTGILRSDDSVVQGVGIWGIPNYHTTLERRAVAGGAITSGYLAMVVAATVMATAGLLLNSAAAVIGSMCVAPFMAPSRAVCIGALFRNRAVFFGGIVKQFVGLLVIGACVAALITAGLRQYFPGIDITPEIALRAMPTSRDVALSVLIAVSAGAAASLALITQPSTIERPWGQVIDAVIGVQVAISLIPPAAVIGIGWALGSPEHSWNAFGLLLLNVIGLDVVGSITILVIRGVRRRHLELEKSIRETVALILHDVPGFIPIGSTVNVTLLGEKDALVDVILRRSFGGNIPGTLAATISDDILEKTFCRANISVEVIPMLTHVRALG